MKYNTQKWQLNGTDNQLIPYIKRIKWHFGGSLSLGPHREKADCNWVTSKGPRGRGTGEGNALEQKGHSIRVPVRAEVRHQVPDTF